MTRLEEIKAVVSKCDEYHECLCCPSAIELVSECERLTAENERSAVDGTIVTVSDSRSGLTRSINSLHHHTFDYKQAARRMTRQLTMTKWPEEW